MMYKGNSVIPIARLVTMAGTRSCPNCESLVLLVEDAVVDGGMITDLAVDLYLLYRMAGNIGGNLIWHLAAVAKTALFYFRQI